MPMKIRVLGSGWYGCHTATHLIACGHDVEIHEIKGNIFAGASGANPARLHLGFHYPRSAATRSLSQANYRTFMDHYGHLTRPIPVNIYAVAKDDSLVDFGNYIQTLRGEVEFLTVEDPAELGLRNVEGAVMTGERVCRIDAARNHFKEVLGDRIKFNMPPGELDDPAWGWTVDCTFSAYTDENVDRFEPCVTHVLEGPKEARSITIMDGPFPSLYAYSESPFYTLTSAKFTPLSQCATYAEARDVLDEFEWHGSGEHLEQSLNLMEHYFPAIREDYEPIRHMTAIRAMPRSGADSRVFDITRGKRSFSVRAGKIDAIFATAKRIEAMLADVEAGRAA